MRLKGGPLKAKLFNNSPKVQLPTTVCWLLSGIPPGRGSGNVRRIVIEAETAGDSSSLFRLKIDGHLIGAGLRAGQVRLLLREVLNRISSRRRSARTAAARA